MFSMSKKSKETIKHATKTTNAERLVERAFERGRVPSSFSGQDRKYLESKERYSTRVIRVYSGCCYIFDNQYLIAVHELPKWFGKKKYDGKTKIRNCKKYYKNHLEEISEEVF